jgi:hypothetical protein
MLLKQHYLPNDSKYQNKKGEWRDQPVDNLIILAQKRYDCWKAAKMRNRVKHINNILHDYSREQRLNPEDDKIVLDYLVTLKTLIESAPKTP